MDEKLKHHNSDSARELHPEEWCQIFLDFYASFNEVLRVGNAEQKKIAIEGFQWVQRQIADKLEGLSDEKRAEFQKLSHLMEKDPSEIAKWGKEAKKKIQELQSDTQALIDSTKKEKKMGSARRRRIEKNMRSKG